MNIQCVAHGIVHHNDRILVYNVIDKSSKKSFYRSIGGHVEFGESSSDTLIREFKEEINECISVFKKLGTYENIFNYKGKTMHEYVTISLVNFNNKRLYSMNEIIGNEGPDRQFIAKWISVDDFINENKTIYPEQTLMHLKNL